MFSPYHQDFTDQVTVVTSPVDATITVPRDSSLDAINNPLNVGSMWFISVDLVQVAVNVGAPAVYGVNAIQPVGLHHPVHLPPGLVLHVITAAQSGSFSLIRARRAG
jgi:hypothetical protein